MSKFFGNGTVIAHDVDDGGIFDDFGQVVRCQPPGRAWDLVDFTVLGDTYQQMDIAPVENAAEWEMAVFQDNDQADQTAINAVVGSNTAHTWRITGSEATLNQREFEAKIFSTEHEQIVPKEGVIKVYKFVNAGAETVS